MKKKKAPPERVQMGDAGTSVCITVLFVFSGRIKHKSVTTLPRNMSLVFIMF